MNILISDPIGQSGLDYLKKCGYSLTYNPTISPEELIDEIVEYDALVVRSRTRVTAELLEKTTKLKVIARSGTGVDTIDVVAATKKNIMVVNAPGANSEAVAEHTMALMLGLARDLVQTATKLSSGIWSKSSYRGMEVKGKTLGVVGFGAVGARVVELGNAFGMRVLVFTKSQSSDRTKQIKSLGASVVDLSTLVKESDIISLHVSLTQQTRGLFDSTLLSQMKPISYFINTSRGAVVDEDALIVALSEGRIAGAALDVFATEPLPASNPLCSMPNVILTPHIAANSKESEERASIMIADDIDRIFQGNFPVRRVTL